jgi:SAM-dependent methyltransferase
VTPDPDKVRIWEARAPAYDELCRRWQIFSLLSNRLIDLLPAHMEGPVLDIGAGSGLTSELLLDRHPHCQAILIEPSEAMLNIARRRLLGRPAQFLMMGLDGALERDVRAVAALASASMQFVDLEPAFAALARLLSPRGYVAFNLWFHHWEETAARQCMTGWQAVAQAACDEIKLPLEIPASPPPKPKMRSDLTNASRANGFELLAEHCDEYPTPIGFGVDFHAMDLNWPVKGCDGVVRQALLARIHELAEGKLEPMVSTRFLLRKA